MADFCTRCRRSFKPWTIRGVTVSGYGPKCAVLEGLLPEGVRRLKKKRRARKIDPLQLNLELPPP